MNISSRDKEKYYWIKLKKDFFKRHDIRILESQVNGKDYVLLYLKLMLESVDHNGRLRFSDTIPYDANMLGTITDTDPGMVSNAMRVFYDLGMIELLDDKTLYLKQVDELLGCQTYGAERLQEYRKNKQLSDTSGTNVPDCNPEIDIETDTEKEKETETDTDTELDGRRVPPTLDEVIAVCRKRRNRVNPERFFNYYEGYGWRKNGIKISNWISILYTWEEKDGFLEDAGNPPLPPSVRKDRGL